MRNKVTERERGREGDATWEIMSGANAASSMKLKPSHNATHGIFPVHIPKQLTSVTSCPLAVIWWARLLSPKPQLRKNTPQSTGAGGAADRGASAKFRF